VNLVKSVVAPGIAVPECGHGIGAVIMSPDSPKLISGVSVRPLALWPDDRGWFLEVARMGQGDVADFDPTRTQVSSALSYPGTIKAFHFHQHQTDLWVPVAGMFQVALVDLRRESPTWGVKNTLYVGALRSWSIKVPAGVGHGYKVIGADPGVLVYLTNQFYNPDDEGRIPYNNSSIHYDWELQHK
jgi:dTDP-4-dehydrorhamnose 3,5-epimerase